MPGQRDPDFLKPCGTYAAYQRHLRRGEPVDEACRLASCRKSAESKGYQSGAGSVSRRALRNGLPETRGYTYRARRYPWAERVLAAAGAEWAEEAAPQRGRPRKADPREAERQRLAAINRATYGG